MKATLDWIILDKGPNGLGFSILDSQDDSGHYVKIRGLVAGGAAEQQGDLKPEDKLIFVNGFHFDMTRFQLQDCVAMLKSLPPGKARFQIDAWSAASDWLILTGSHSYWLAPPS